MRCGALFICVLLAAQGFSRAKIFLRMIITATPTTSTPMFANIAAMYVPTAGTALKVPARAVSTTAVTRTRTWWSPITKTRDDETCDKQDGGHLRNRDERANDCDRNANNSNDFLGIHLLTPQSFI